MMLCLTAIYILAFSFFRKVLVIVLIIIMDFVKCILYSLSVSVTCKIVFRINENKRTENKALRTRTHTPRV